MKFHLNEKNTKIAVPEIELSAARNPLLNAVLKKVQIIHMFICSYEVTQSAPFENCNSNKSLQVFILVLYVYCIENIEYYSFRMMMHHDDDNE